MARRLSLILSLVGLLLAFAVTPAFASQPTGYVGACNMLHDASMATIPMVRNNPDGSITLGNGNAGMWHAVDVSGCL
jgi:hypothetical protein